MVPVAWARVEAMRKGSDSVCILNFIIREKTVIYRKGQGINTGYEDLGLSNWKAAGSNTSDEKGCERGLGQVRGFEWVLFGPETT